jgi:KaiC/GvpD/RAD55 family RecA-like ATPase
MSSMELRLLHSLVHKEIYADCIDIVSPTAFSEDLQDIAEAIQHCHDEFTTGVDLDVVQEYLRTQKVSTTAKDGLLEVLFDKIRQVDPVDKGVARKFIYNIAVRDQRLTALDTLARIIEKNEESHEEVVSILSKHSVEDTNEGEIVPSDLKELEAFYNVQNKYPFNIPMLQRQIGGLAKGNLAIVFGRPEIGKSSFVASMVAEYLKKGIKVEYYANEEPGMKIMLNIRRACTGEDDRAIAKAIRANKDTTEWPKYATNLTVRQIGAMSMEAILSRTIKRKPEVVILDQVDKLHLMQKYDATHEKLKALYQKSREVAQTGACLVVNVSQASIDAEGKGYVPYSMLDGSKTGKAGEADMIIGLGKEGLLHPPDEDERAQQLSITISKNKVNGWHGRSDVWFDAHTNQWSDRNESSNAAT